MIFPRGYLLGVRILAVEYAHGMSLVLCAAATLARLSMVMTPACPLSRLVADATASALALAEDNPRSIIEQTARERANLTATSPRPVAVAAPDRLSA